jgi:fatty-acyl-CoA synthase
MDGLAFAPPLVGEIVSRRVEGDLHRLSGIALTARVRRLAGALAAAGLRPGDRVAALAWNGHRAVELALVCAASCARLVAVDPEQHPDAIVRLADEAGARILFFDLSFMPLVESIAPRLAAARCSVALAGAADMPGPAAIPDLCCYEAMLDGEPQASACALPANDAARFAICPEDVVLVAEPMHRRDGADLVGAALLSPARRLVLPGPWLDGRSLHQMIAGEGVTVAAASAAIWQRLLAHAEREGAGFAGLERALVTGDPAVAAPVARMLRDRHGVAGIDAGPTPLHGWGAEAGVEPVVSR